MGPLTGTQRHVRRSVSVIVLMATIFTLAATRGFAATPSSEIIHANFSQAGGTIGITLSVYNYSTLSDLQILSAAFQGGQDRELATALSRTKPVGRSNIAGNLGYDVAFVQMVRTPTGRQITFITSRPHPSDESDPPAAPSRSIWLLVGST